MEKFKKYNLIESKKILWELEKRGIGRSSYFEKSGVSYNTEKRESGCISGFALENCHNDGASNILFLHNLRYSTIQLFPELEEQSTRSAIYFRGLVGGFNHTIKIYKDTCGIHLLYSYDEDYDCYLRQPKNGGYSLDLPVLSPGNISIEEVDAIMSALIGGFGEPKFVGIVTHELAKFRKMICINKGLTPRDDSILNPEAYGRELKKSDNMSLESLEDIKSFRFRPRNLK